MLTHEGGTLRLRVRSEEDGAGDDRLPARLRVSRRLRRVARQRHLAPAERAARPPSACSKACRAGRHLRRSTPGRATAPTCPTCRAAKYERGNPTIHIGDEGPMGRLLVRGSYGHDIVEEVYPIEGEPVVDKPGKGAFYATDMDAILKMPGHREADRLRRDHRGLRPDQRPRGERPRLRRRRPLGLRRVLLPRVPAGRAGDDQGPGRHLRLGQRLEPPSSRPSASRAMAGASA